MISKSCCLESASSSVTGSVSCTVLGGIRPKFPVSVSYDGVTILGTPIGKPEFVRSQCTDIARSGEQLCCQLTKLDNKQCSMLILRHCHVPRMNYLA